MSNNLQSSATRDDTTEQGSTARVDSDSRSVGKRLKVLFCCCFKPDREPPENEVDSNPDEYDHIVKKLFAKRVPVALFAIASDVPNREEPNVTEGTPNPLPSTRLEKKNVYSVQREDRSSLRHAETTDRETTSNSSPDSNPHFEKAVITENNERVSLIDEDACTEKKMRETELLNTLSAFHQDLKESERPPKDPCPLNPPRDKRCFAENISELASVNQRSITDDRNAITDCRLCKYHTDTSEKIDDVSGVSTRNYAALKGKSEETSKLSKNSKHSRDSLLTTDSINSKDSRILSQREQNNSRFKQSQNPSLYSNESGDDDDFKREEEFIVVPVQTRHMSDNENKLKKGYTNTNLQTTDNTLQRSQTSTKTSAAASEIVRNVNVSNTVLRWKIIIKHHESETDSSEAAKDINMDQNQSKG